MWQTHDRHGNLIYTRNRPTNSTAPTTRSTLRWLGARCNGERFPGRIPCQTDPLTSLQVKTCTGIPPPLNASPPRAYPCCGDVCTSCVSSVANHWSGLESQAIRKAHRTKLCRQCQLYEARRHPCGYSGCVCRSLLSDGWKCWSCRHETLRQVRNKSTRQWTLIREFHRDRQGRKISDPDRPPTSKPVCPGCARSFINRDLQISHVTYCMSCNGVIVKASVGPDYRPTELMPTRPVRWSARIAAKYATTPPLDFKAIKTPRRS